MGDHWYQRNGFPCYEQTTAKGGKRNTDLRDARKLGLVPSVTTVLQVIAKPQLEVWKVRQGILAALTLGRGENEPDDAFLNRVLRDSQEQVVEAADEGTRIHDACESFYKSRVVVPKYRAHVDAVAAEVKRLFLHVDDWVSEAYFASEDGYGGKIDLHSPKWGHVVDFKGKDGDFSDDKKLDYDQHWQLAPYNRGKRLPLATCANVFFSRTHPGAVASRLWTEEEVTQGWDVFEAALMLWKRLKRFDPAFKLPEPKA